MIRKFFPLDKNYLLKEAQAALQDLLLTTLIDACKAHYEVLHNPLQLSDSFSVQIKNYQPDNLAPLDPFYQTLAGVYRYKFGNNQLEFLWDGQSHFEKYKTEWSRVFDEWCAELCRQPQFIQAILDLTVFLQETQDTHLACNRMNFAMLHYFTQHEDYPALKFRKAKGVVEMVA